MAKDAVTGRTGATGRSKSHGRGVAGKRWKKRAQVTKRKFNLNIQKATLLKDGKLVKVNVSTKTLKRLKKGGTMNGYSYPQA